MTRGLCGAWEGFPAGRDAVTFMLPRGKPQGTGLRAERWSVHRAGHQGAWQEDQRGAQWGGWAPELEGSSPWFDTEMSPLQNKLLQRSAHIRVSLSPPSPGGAALTVRFSGCGVGAGTGKVSQGIAVWKGRGQPRRWNILSAQTSPGKLTGLERRFLPPESQRGSTFVFMTHLHFPIDQVIVWHRKAARGKFHLPPPGTEQ